MSEQVKAIVSQLQGKIEEANKEAEAIIAKANREAAEIRESAENQSKQIIEESKKKIELMNKAHQDKLKQAVRDTLIELKEKILKEVINQSINKTFLVSTNNPETILEAILILCKGFSKHYNDHIDLKILLGEDLYKNIGVEIQKIIHSKIKAGIEVQIDTKIKGGFKIGLSKSSYIFDFSDSVLAAIFSHSYGKQIEEQIFA